MNTLCKALALVIAGTLLTASCAGAEPVNIIFDTDMGGDCDDVGALFILHGAIERGEVKLLATMGCVSSDAIAPCLDAINTWFGRPGIPVGTLKDPGFHADFGNYAGEIVKRYPHRFASGKDYPDAVALYREILAKQPDASVRVVAVGMLRNMQNLLRSQPDAASPLDGRALIMKKVARLDVMGGKYPPAASRNEKDGEYNFAQDPPATAFICAEWPTPILFNGEGGSTCSGRRVTYEMPEHNPLTMAYRWSAGIGYARDRMSWDPITALVAVHGAAPWFKVISTGTNVADARSGVNTWHDGAEHGHAYLVAQGDKTATEAALEDMMVSGRGHPAHLTFNTASYAVDGMCQISASGTADAASSPIRAFDIDHRTAWLDKGPSSWIQCQYVDGRKYLVTSYAVTCARQDRVPRTLELSGSNDGGATWTRVDVQAAPGFGVQALRREFPIQNPAKWNLWRLAMTAANADEGVQIAEIELNEAIACTPGMAAAAVTLDRMAITMPAHGRATLGATIAPADVYDRDVTWISSDPGVASVRRIGEQLAMVVGNKPGTCLVTAASGKASRTCSVTVTDSTLPSGWSFSELYAPPIPGAVTVAGGVFTLTGCGDSIHSWWQRMKDQGSYVSQAFTGNAVLSARLLSLGPNVGGPSYHGDNHPATTAGLMIREDLSDGCGRFMLIQVDASGSLVCRWRDKVDENEQKVLGKVDLPIFVRIAQSGKDIQVFTSTDGQTWGEPRMSHTTAADGAGRIGLFVCSGNTFAATTAVFAAVERR